MKNVKSIVKITKAILAKNFPSVNIKKTNPKFRNCFEKFKLMQMELRLKSKLTTRKMKFKKSVNNQFIFSFLYVWYNTIFHYYTWFIFSLILNNKSTKVINNCTFRSFNKNLFQKGTGLIIIFSSSTWHNFWLHISMESDFHLHNRICNHKTILHLEQFVDWQKW